MKGKKQITISLNTLIIIIAIVIIIGMTVFFVVNKMNKQGEIVKKSISDTINIKTYENNDYYIIKGDYSGEYDLQYTKLSEYFNSESNEAEEFKKKEVMNYSEYESYCNEWELKKEYSDTSKNYIVFSYVAYGSPILEARLAAVDYNGNNVDIYIWDRSSGDTADISAYCIVIPTDKEINNINLVGVYTNTEFNNIKKYNNPFNPDEISIDKPVIYLYPIEETEVTVKVGNPQNLTHTYPKYENEWRVLAKPNGDLKDLKTGRNLYALYWEGISTIEPNMKEGFVVKGEDTIKFLEEKLEILGLNEREAEEFIVYWLPKLESNKYNFIRFQTEEEINNNMPLEITPKPDTVIRILMEFKGIEEPIQMQEQKLSTPQRKGFTVVEWGGTEIK